MLLNNVLHTLHIARLSLLGAASDTGCLLKAGGDVIEYFVDYADAVHRNVFILLQIIIAQWHCLAVVDIKTGLDCVYIVICTACFLSTFDHAVHKFLFGDFETDHRMKFGSAFAE